MQSNTQPNNVTSIESKKETPAAKFTITALLEGFPVQVEVEGKASDLRALVDRLKAIGAEPPTPAQPEPSKSGPPVCPIHSAPMKASSAKSGTFFCPKKNDDGAYCKQKA